jgi:hypothetical protein
MSEFLNCLSESSSKLYRKVGPSGNSLVTIAIGEKTLKDWEENALELWLEYCQRWDLGLICIIDNLVEESSVIWKKATWQKLLIPAHLQGVYPSVKRACYLDTDILISPLAQNIFLNVPQGQVGLVSMYKSLPYERKDTLDRISYFRNVTSGGQYPLDSSLYISLNDLYEYHNLSPMNDYACMGLIVFDVDNPKINLFLKYFERYNREVSSITNGGDQTHLNFHIQSDFEICWLDYKWQALWIYEAANKYPGAFWTESYTSGMQDIACSLSTNYFLHFAGSWPESQIWKDSKFLRLNQVFKSLLGYEESKKLRRLGKPVGPVKYNPNSKLATQGKV